MSIDLHLPYILGCSFSNDGMAQKEKSKATKFNTFIVTMFKMTM